MKIRMARLEDAPGITGVHCSGIEVWYRFAETGKIKSEYAKLSIRDRYRHGGPWMSVESCAVHLNSLLLENQIPLVAEIDGKIVGNAEILISKERVNGRMRKIAHLDVLEVHKDFRKRGIGRAIVEFGERIARERGCELLTVVPEKSAMGFYSKLGIDKILYSGIFASFDLSKFPEESTSPVKREFSWEEVKEKEMILGKFQSSYHHWFTAFKDRIAGIDDRVHFESGTLEGNLYILEESFFEKETVTLYAWGGNTRDALILLGNRARELGFKHAKTIIPEEEEENLKDLEFTEIEREVILLKELL
ncbi:GNAT family N-acetyltransferase [Palaeococcus sp. (in: euryarchaeotes)]